jgi:outer membrane protein OmpA-like peptidoglycan-associated protein
MSNNRVRDPIHEQNKRFRNRKKYPLLGIEPARGFGLNRGMKRMLLIGLIAVGSSCHTDHGRRPYVPDPPRPHEGSSSTDSAEAVAVARPVVRLPKPPEPEPHEPEAVIPPDLETRIREINARLQDAFFDYDRSEPRAEALDALRRDADLLRGFFPEFPALKVTIQGHCDERGSGEYNLALGARRAWRAAEILKEFGVPLARSETISFGKEAPQCTDANEVCWQKNRRAHLVIQP